LWKGSVIKVAKDNVGLISDTARETFTVLLGQPSVDSIAPKTTWINDDSTYTIFAHDINGSIKRYLWDLDNNGSWDDSANTDTLTAHFTSAGTKQVRVGVRDDDTLLVVDTFPVIVRLGKPRVWNPSGDTLFVKWPSSGDVVCKVNEFDSNGVLSMFYWDFAQGNGLDTNVAAQYKVTADSFTYNTQFPDQPLRMAVFGKDDDGLMAGDTFYLYPDGPPAIPDTVSPSKNVSVTGSVKFIWQNVDMHDQAATQYQILCDDKATPVASIVNYQSGTSFTSEGANRFSYTKSLSGAGVKFWRVLAKDSRGSVVQGPISWFIYTP
jgi:hypothetical protein